MSSYSGYVLSHLAAGDLTAKGIERLQPTGPEEPVMRHIRHCYGMRRWDEYLLHSHVGLADEPEGTKDIYEYQVYVIRGRAKIVALAHRRRIVDYVISKVLDRTISPKCRRVSIPIEKVVRHCVSLESEFLVTSLHGRFAGAARDVRSLSIYGDDVTSSSLYADYHDKFNFHSGGLGRRLYDGLPRLRSNEEGEIVRVSHDGFVTLMLTGKRRAEELVAVVSFLSENAWFEDSFPSGAQ